MDLHPTFGRQELFETLSQGSARSSSRGGLSNSEKSNSRSRQQIQQQNSIQDEAAIRLLGHKLSLQAHEGPNPASMSTTPAEFGWSSHSSCFTPYHETNVSLPSQSIADPTTSASTTTAAVPVRKVAKMQLHDHGNHHLQHQQHHDDCPSPDESDGDSDNHHHSKSDRMSVDTQQQQHSSNGCWSQDEQDNYMEQQSQSQPGQSIMSLDLARGGGGGSNRTSLPLANPCSSFVLHHRNVTKRLTAQCRECYDAIAKAQSIISSMSVLSQQQQQHQEQHSRFSWKNSSHNNHFQHHPPRRNLLNNKKKSGTKGILASVMETSATISSGGRSEKEDCSTSRATQSISTKDCAATTTTWNGTHHSKDQSLPSSPPPPDHSFYAATMPRGACLTEPSVGTANDGEDNDDGNLICYENDLISVPRKTLRMLMPNNNNKRSSARCAADFRILRRTGQGTFAQVFEVLHLQTNDILALKIIKNKPAYTRQAAIEIDIYQTLRQAPQKQQASSSSSSDYMVHLHAYFMHKNHLCLVFELLGCNLYEVLKRRQFRGLSVSLVQDMMRQALAGIRELANQNIVHCDLKPENILLTTDDGTKRVVESDTNKHTGTNTAGQQNRHGNNSSKTTSSTTSSDNTQSSAMLLDNASGLQYGMNQNGGSSASSSHQGLANSTTHASNGASSSSTSTRLMANNNSNNTDESIKIKLIDFGSACFEGLTAHTYIQSRFYRSPEVLLGLPYDSSIDMWSLGCLAAELFLGLPILPGMHEHDQMRRITEMISPIPDWMLEQGSKATKCYVKYFPRNSPSPHQPYHGSSSTSPTTSSSLQPKWRLKTQHEYVIALSQSEVRKRGGLEKLNKPINNRYFKREKLCDIVNLHAQHSRGIDRNLVRSFIHFLYGLLDPDPWKRLTAFQASQHPFITGELELLLPSTARPTDIPIKEMNQSNLLLDSYWQPPWDPSVCRRKLLHVQKLREKQNTHRLARSSSRASMVPPFEDQLGDQQSIVSPQSSEVPAQVSSSCSNTSPYSALFHFGGPNRHQNDFGQQQSQTTTCSQDATFQNVHPDYIVDGYSSFASSSQGFGQAIERPGVIPGNYSVSSTCNSQSIGYSSAQSGSLQSNPQVLNTMFQNQVQASWQSNSGFPNGGNLSGAGDSVPQHHQFLDHVSVRSTASSISDATMITDAQYQGFLAQQQQQQFLLAQQQQFLLAQQQQQFGAYPTGIPPFQQMPMRFDQQQIPPQTAMPGGGTYFYMVNPATGQPMLLQAVDFPNQPLNHHPFIVSQEHLGVPMDNNQGPQFMNPRQAQLVHGGSDRHEMSSARSARRRTSRGGMSM